MKKKIDFDNFFMEVYNAFPSYYCGREDIDISNNIILPESALKALSKLKNFGDSKNPLFFRILNIELNVSTMCGVADFTAEEGTCYLPNVMFEKLYLLEGQKVNIRKVDLEPGKSVKLRPQLNEFIKYPNSNNIVKYGLLNYFCVTTGDIISVNYKNKIYKFDVIQCQPKSSINISNGNIDIEFDDNINNEEEENNNEKLKNNIILNSVNQ